jgi:exosome complex RNA-binding protein Rrp42 (RNase PH superfamily)
MTGNPLTHTRTHARVCSVLLLDPTDEEEVLADAVATAVARADGSLVAHWQSRGTRPFTHAHTESLCAAAARRTAELTALITAAAPAAP